MSDPYKTPGSMELAQKPSQIPGTDHFDGRNWDIQGALQGGWNLFKDNVGVALGALGVSIGVNVVFSVLNQGTQLLAQDSDSTVALIGALLSLMISLVSMVVQSLVTLGVLKIYLGIVRGQSPTLGDMFNVGHLIVSTLVASFAVGLATMFGFMLFIVPGVILALGLSFYQLLIADRDLTGFDGGISALKESWRLTDGHKGQLFLWGLVSSLLIFLSMCTFVGVFVTIPMVGLGHAMIYDNVVRNKGIEV